ncbi:hypothetical protein CG723_12590 [Streptomyces sp. CB01635]|uniref:hypothetical protein n=1 Tax=unclassified Streptomyces TaxID=2593676 RepID=UPI000C27C75B|nr:hypothetical protein [Streptomyces sp. CB01635]PJN11696.1 hypothetical protein CG723_12590 [Streptomyces sp. CB01635]
MRRTVTGIALVAATAALLAGCGSGGGDSKEAGAKQDTSKAPSHAASKPAGGQEATREVTFEVQGQGSTQVLWTAGESKTEQVNLPWTKTTRLTIKGAELKVGSLVSVVPGSVAASDGRLEPASCVIKVDGKQVADNKDGKSIAGCKYLVK